MISSNVLYLASNSLTNPKNTPGKFSILYNNPLDLSGKKIALVSATFTKGQANVLEEEISVFYTPSNSVEKGRALLINMAERASLKKPISWAQYFTHYTTDLYGPGDSNKRQKLISISAVFNAAGHVPRMAQCRFPQSQP
jgi:hypothetical protein